MGRKENDVKDSILWEYGSGDEFIFWKVANVFFRLADGRGVRGGSIRGFGDLVGIRKLLIMPEHIGLTIGQYVTVETKQPGAYTAPELNELQEIYLNNVTDMGGFACRAYSMADFAEAKHEWDKKLRIAS